MTPTTTESPGPASSGSSERQQYDFGSANLVVRVILVLVGFFMAISARAETIKFFSKPNSVNQTSAGAAMDGAFRFEVGVFTGSFVPTPDNTAQWAANWVPAKGVAYNPTTRYFTGQFTVVSNTAPFTVGKPAYIRGFRGDASNGEWILFRKATWTWPAPNPFNPYGLDWSAADADDVVLGKVNASGSPFLMRAAAVPLGDGDGDGVADTWDLVNGSVPLPPMYPGAVLAWSPPTAVAGPFDCDVATLPPGITFNATTGNLIGRPTAAGNYSIRVRARQGAAWSPWQSIPVAVQAWPASATGLFSALVSRHAGFNESMGGMLTLSTTSTGAYTGTLRLGRTTLGIRGFLAGKPGATPAVVVDVPRTGLSTLRLVALLGSDRILRGSLSDASGAIAVTGWQRIWEATTTPMPVAYQGYFTAHLTNAAGLAPDGRPLPSGRGWMTFTTTAGGVATGVGKLADGSPVGFSAFVGPTGQLLWWVLPSTGTDSVLGALQILANGNVDGSPGWVKTANAASRLYPRGFGTATSPVMVAFRGARYVAPAGNAALTAWGLAATSPNARLDMIGGGVETAKRNPDVRFAITTASSVVVPAGGTTANPASTRLTLTPATGRFIGTFALVDPLPGQIGTTMPRNVAYDGVIVTRAGDTSTVFGIGRYQLPALPALGQDPATTPIWAGAAFLIRIPPVL